MPVPLLFAQVAASLIAPGLALAGAVAVAVPVTLHLLSKRRRRQRPWAAMRFLREAIEKQRRRLRFERWLLLACRCVALVLLGLALAGPLVGGPLAAAFGVAGAAGRSVDLLIDNGIAAGAVDVDGSVTRLDAAKAEAAAVLATLGPDDRVRVWPLAGRAGDADGLEAGSVRPDPAAVTPAEAAAAVETITLTDAGPAWAGVLPRVAEASRAESAEGRAAAVVVLSPLFAGDGSLAAGRGPSAQTAEDGDGPRVWLSRPAAGRDNLQVASVRPARAVVPVGQPGAASRSAGLLDALVTVRRAGSAPGGVGLVEAEVRVEVVQELSGAAGSPLEALRSRPVVATGSAGFQLPAGVEEVTRRVTLAATRGAARGPALLVARLDGTDALAADDTAVAALELVEGVAVGLLGGDPATEATGFGPAGFFDAALGAGVVPRGSGPDAAFLPQRLNTPNDARRDGQGAVDAVVLLDPASIGAAGRERLAAFAAAGGALWITPSASAPADDPGAGMDALLNGLGLGWTTGAPPAATEAGEAEEPARAAASGTPPAALPLLAGQWEALLRPIRFERRVWLTGVDPADVWVSFEGGGVALASGRATGPGGEPGTGGRVVVLASAVDPAWTNLPAKPLFPALVRDGLFAAVAARAEAVPTTASPRVGEERAGVDAASSPPALTAADVDAADTSAVADPRAAAFFAGLGEVSFLTSDDPAVFPAESARASLAGGLLWVVLALLVLEAIAGRAFTRTGAA